MTNEQVFLQSVKDFGRQFANDHFSMLWWAQDGVPAHNALEVREWMEEFFRNHIIALNHEIEWPPGSSDQTPCDFFVGLHQN